MGETWCPTLTALPISSLQLYSYRQADILRDKTPSLRTVEEWFLWGGVRWAKPDVQLWLHCPSPPCNSTHTDRQAATFFISVMGPARTIFCEWQFSLVIFVGIGTECLRFIYPLYFDNIMICIQFLLCYCMLLAAGMVRLVVVPWYVLHFSSYLIVDPQDWQEEWIVTFGHECFLR